MNEIPQEVPQTSVEVKLALEQATRLACRKSSPQNIVCCL